MTPGGGGGTLVTRYFDAVKCVVWQRRCHTSHNICSLAKVYGLDNAAAASQWRLSHHLVLCSTSILEAYGLIPLSYTELRRLYRILLTLPATTASVERGFSKLSLVKTKLHSTMGQERLEALLLASVEKDILLQLDNAELVARFAGKNDRRMLLS